MPTPPVGTEALEVLSPRGAAAQTGGTALGLTGLPAAGLCWGPRVNAPLSPLRVPPSREHMWLLVSSVGVESGL